MLEICEPGVIDKTRYLVKAGEHTYEVDEFYGDNEGLTVAEVELSDENEAFDKPSWLGEEVRRRRQVLQLDADEESLQELEVGPLIGEPVEVTFKHKSSI